MITGIIITYSFISMIICGLIFFEDVNICNSEDNSTSENIVICVFWSIFLGLWLLITVPKTIFKNIVQRIYK